MDVTSVSISPTADTMLCATLSGSSPTPKNLHKWHSTNHIIYDSENGLRAHQIRNIWWCVLFACIEDIPVQSIPENTYTNVFDSRSL